VIHWEHASQGDRDLLQILRGLCEQHPKLIDFMFHPTRAALRAEPKTLHREARCFSSGEQILVRVAIDLWGNLDHVKLSELGRLDSSNFQRVIAAFSRIRL